MRGMNMRELRIGKEREVLMRKDDVSSTEPVLEIRYLTYTEVAKILRCSERTVHNRVKNGDIVPLRNGRLILFTRECIEDFLNQHHKPIDLKS
jgi:excisionase family DNA binding protein